VEDRRKRDTGGDADCAITETRGMMQIALAQERIEVWTQAVWIASTRGTPTDAFGRLSEPIIRLSAS
jgi:hypothetical protein